MKVKNNRKKPRFYLFCYRFTNEVFPIHIKYGISINIQQRIVALQTPQKPYLITALNFDFLHQARMFEKYFKKMLTDYNADGEWLVLNNQNDVDHVQKIYNNFSSFCEEINICEYKELNFKTN